MKLADHEKARLLHYAELVYQGYWALDQFKSRQICGREGKLTLLDICKTAHKDGPLTQKVSIAEKLYELTLTPTREGYDVSFSRPVIQVDPLLDIKTLDQYTDEDVRVLLTRPGQHFKLHVGFDGDLAVSLSLDAQHTIGGPGKIDLYRTHLLTLHNIIKKIGSEGELTALLVALATGTGKTYVQALWMYILNLAGFTAIFAIPDELIKQFCDDLACLLPKDVTRQILCLRNASSPAAEEALADLQTPGKTLVVANERLLDQYYQVLLEAPANSTFLSFDEQHLLTRNERHDERLHELSQHFLTMYLTATPTRKTFDAAKPPVATMSNGQKKRAGQGLLPRVVVEQAKSAIDVTREHTPGWKDKIKREALLRIGAMIVKDHSSAVDLMADSLPYYGYYDPNDSQDEGLRWGLHVPMARKMLCIVDDSEALVNLVMLFKKPDVITRYHEGAMVQGLSTVLQDEAMVSRIGFDCYKLAREEKFKQLPPEAQDCMRPMIDNGLRSQLKSNMFHYLVEYVLSDLTGLSHLEQNKSRKRDLQQFICKVQAGFKLRDRQYYVDTLRVDLDEEGARELAPLLAMLSSYLKQVIQQNKADELRDFVDNWFLNSDMLPRITRMEDSFEYYFDTYADKYMIMAVMQGMKAADVPIADAQPFTDMTRKAVKVYDEHGRPLKTAKRRKRGFIETVTKTATDTQFEPSYLAISEEIADKYFRLGFMGVYISNKKEKGFNDKHLQTVVNLTEHAFSPNHSPETLIQSYGRNRGLDETMMPYYVHFLGRQQQPSFHLGLLDNDDYYPAFFTAQTRYDDQRITSVGETLGQDVVNAYYANKNPDESIDDARLKRRVLRLVAGSLRTVNDKNGHQMGKSRGQLRPVVSAAMAVLDKEIDRIQNPYAIPWVARPLLAVASFGFAAFNLRERWGISRQLGQHEASMHDDHLAVDKVYLKIVRKHAYKDFIALVMPAMELANFAAKNVALLPPDILRTVEGFLPENDVARLRSLMANPDLMVRLVPSLAMLPPELKILIALMLSLLTMVNSEQLSQIIDTLMPRLLPVIVHPQLLAALDLFVGDMVAEDLVEIFTALSHPAPAVAAARVLLLREILQAQDIRRLKTEFLTLPEEMDSSTSLPLVQVGQDLLSLGQEIVACTCYFNSHDMKMEEFSGPRPVLVARTSLALQQIRVPYHKFEGFVFAAQGGMAGVRQAADINQDANAHDISALKRIKTHILRPLWWTVNLSNIAFAIVAGMKRLCFAIADLGIALWQRVKAGWRWIKGIKPLETSIAATVAHIDEDYNAAAFKFAAEVNQLRALTRADVAASNCPRDLIEPLLVSIGDDEEIGPLLDSIGDDEDGLDSPTTHGAVRFMR